MTQQQAIDKALKLLRLAKSSNQHEAALAAAQAQRIIDEHKLDIEAIDYDAQDKERDAEEVRDFGYADPLDKYSHESTHRWYLQLASIVARANGCHTIYANRIFNEELNAGCMIKIVGHPSDVQTVRYLYAVLKGEVQRITKENTKGNSWAYRRAFSLGVVDTISRKLSEQKQATQKEARQKFEHNPMALVRVNAALAKIEKRTLAVSQYIEGMRLRKGRGPSFKSDETVSARAHGRACGEAVRIGSAKAALGSGKHQIGN